ncbi:hypothetical protein [Dellaglioa algida]|uniref:HTH cro/C1-type domain-containing protein n=1 Tax=Dellaglioa algida TaxID=105612 RepID=A0A5C6M7I8_9LACO|nr:hypothetical protein [Dellaglioa algida]MDK1720192.1 hypothetical protein [Dellaglioa algida]MDK1723582.1 hypothetical protein [Dellaglioa algida]TWW10133.1 hypothetical protein LABALGLTS371_16150 [Dellaglioa algida]
MTEKMIIDAAKEFIKRVDNELTDRDMNRRELASKIGYSQALLSNAINSYSLNNSSRKIRKKVREYLNIED